MKPHHIFAEAIDGKALSQFYDGLKQDFAVRGALMPDAHAGYALPIGAVVATDGVVVPAWVGYDIGCGMCALPLNIGGEDIRANAKAIFDQIYRDIPTGFSHNQKAEEWPDGEKIERTSVIQQQLDDGALRQLGSLGSGNHFIEIGEDEAGGAWVVIHSGSRNVGHKTATHYMKLASPDGKAREDHLPLRIGTAEGDAYVVDLRFCLAFALENRLRMMQRVVAAVQRHAGLCNPDWWDGFINRNHNHAEPRDGLWIHRKGATHAEDGVMGVIPGNMRDGSFIVRGKGNSDALYSSSHGAGRVLGRKQAKEALKVEDFTETMVGIVAKVDMATLDESPFAYKSIFDVMAQQADLVEVVHHVRPIINIKG
ncbi:MAG: RtcB family protein [Desulfovibrio sp.]|uniref:RtcB family protein n=1 Tax=Desulfovibrio sp. TaxID=885 RepID=UPI00135EF11D|nr:RtcB family protein [Desulfovibrio sp.]MTJ93607.1 RtcB family protein [Desulfovibrio sp.]